MRIELQIDGLYHNIDSRNPQTIAAWLAEWFASTEWHPSTYVQVRVFPTYNREATRADWVTDSGWLEQLPGMGEVRTPRAMLEAIMKNLEEYEKE